MNKRNYSKELEAIIAGLDKSAPKPKLLLHVCCAPCSSYCLEYLAPHFDITVFFYNPNMDSSEEYAKRAAELRRFVKEADLSVDIVIREYDSKPFYDMARGLENVPEGGVRCFKCYELRLKEAAKFARDYGFDYFTTTLSISPLKNSQKINEIGEMIGRFYHVDHLPSDFKKKDGYKRSIELSHEYNLYRQNYCGCVYSKSNELA
ncbi:MAG: epoxyqueuosine reductase QueH [Lachnospiraceae bacterium]|nr:epoxyqueuosine reductase QueH [Lachnospiraceae bacterium]